MLKQNLFLTERKGTVLILASGGVYRLKLKLIKKDSAQATEHLVVLSWAFSILSSALLKY